jgi:hypothetical protein
MAWFKFSRPIAFGLPDKFETFLVFMFGIFFLWWDLLQNKVLDLGKDYRVTWFGDITSRALDLSIVILICFHIVLLTLFIMSLKSKRTHEQWDIIVGGLAFFGVAIVLAGFVNSLYSETIRFLFIDMKSISFYHIGVGIEMFAGAYWALSK